MDAKKLNFWERKSKIIHWFVNPKKIFSIINGKFFFYEDGKTNIAYNCIKKNIDEGKGNKIAVIFIDEDNQKKYLTYSELENLVNHFIKYLFKNFKKKDLFENPIAIHSSANLCSCISMLACMKLGITHCVMFNDLSKEAIEVRCRLIKCKLLITSAKDNDYNSKIKLIKRNLGLKVIRFSVSNSSKKLSVNFDQFFKKKNIFIDHKYNFVNSNTKSFILFTSGSTGEPKGIIHSTGGYLVYSKYTCVKKFNISEKTTILTASDAGWINGHTYALYGPLSLGATTILLEKPMNLLNEKLLQEVLIKLKVNIFYAPVTLIRLIKALKIKTKIRSSSLKLLGSMGEPLSKFVGIWFSKTFSKKQLQIVNTYFQTETGGILSSPSFKDKLKDVPYGTVGKPITKNLGMFIEKNKSEIKVKNLWPGCMIGVVNNNKVFDDYWDKNKNFRLFDLASYDKNKNFLIHGRLDDVINIRGHRIGSAEIESIILKSDIVKEACAISVDDDLSGKKLIIFLVLRIKKNINRKNIYRVVENLILKHFGSFALPERIILLSELPKTRSGKILRRLLRDLYLNPKTNQIGDLSTILNYKVVNQIKKILLNYKN
jgi:acetyl-CoA synthetase